MAPLVSKTSLRKSDLEDDTLSLLNNRLDNYADALNYLLGLSGDITLGSNLNLGGNKITNVGAAESPSDVVTQAFAYKNYGPAALQPAFNALGKQTLQTYRQLSNPNQREKYSSFLNETVSTPPSSNTSIVTFGSPSGGTVPVTVTAGFHQRVDGSSSAYSARTDTLALPASFAISSLARTSNIVTVITSSPTGLLVGEGFTITGALDTSYDGTFVVETRVSATEFKFYQGGANSTSSGGDVLVGGVYYYTLTYGQNALGLVTGNGATDTTSNRVAASNDGTTIIAVVVTNGSGGDPVNSAAGASPQQTGANVAVIRRL